MVTLGLDLSSKKSGYSLFIDNKLIEYGLWENNNDDWRERIIYMSNQLDTYIKTHKIDRVIVEDVPLDTVNPKTLKILSALQGTVITVCEMHNMRAEFISVSTWRSSLGLFNGKRDGTRREVLKKESIEYANKTFGLELVWKSKTSKFNQDDIADSINVAWSQIKPKKSFGRR